MKFKDFLREMVGSGTGTGDVAPFARKLMSPVKRKYPEDITNLDDISQYSNSMRKKEYYKESVLSEAKKKKRKLRMYPYYSGGWYPYWGFGFGRDSSNNNSSNNSDNSNDSDDGGDSGGDGGGGE